MQLLFIGLCELALLRKFTLHKPVLSRDLAQAVSIEWIPANHLACFINQSRPVTSRDNNHQKSITFYVYGLLFHPHPNVLPPLVLPVHCDTTIRSLFQNFVSAYPHPLFHCLLARAFPSVYLHPLFSLFTRIPLVPSPCEVLRTSGPFPHCLLVFSFLSAKGFACQAPEYILPTFSLDSHPLFPVYLHPLFSLFTRIPFPRCLLVFPFLSAKSFACQSPLPRTYIAYLLPRTIYTSPHCSYPTHASSLRLLTPALPYTVYQSVQDDLERSPAFRMSTTERLSVLCKATIRAHTRELSGPARRVGL